MFGAHKDTRTVRTPDVGDGNSATSRMVRVMSERGFTTSLDLDLLYLQLLVIRILKVDGATCTVYELIDPAFLIRNVFDEFLESHCG